MGNHARGAPQRRLPGRRRSTGRHSHQPASAAPAALPGAGPPPAPFGTAPAPEPVGLPTPDLSLPSVPTLTRLPSAPPVPQGRLGPVRVAAVGLAVLGVITGIGRVAPDPHSASAVAMTPTGANVLRGILPDEALPDVPGPPGEPRQVAGPEPLPAPAPAAAGLPALFAPEASATPARAPGASERGIPGAVLAAYRGAAASMAIERPGCRLTWPILAGIGRIESGHARDGDVDVEGTTRTRIVGPALDGTGNFARIMDSDGGLWDGDTTYDRAVGPMQFLPGTWRGAGRDGNADGRPDPNNVRDAALASAGYLCSGGGDMFVREDLLGAIFRYNRSWEYVSNVLTWAGVYATLGAVTTGGTGGSGNGARSEKGAGRGGRAQPAPSPAVTPRPTQQPTQAPRPTTEPVTSPTKGPAGGATPAPTTGAGQTPTPTPTPAAPQPAAAAGRVLDDLGRAVSGARVAFTGPTAKTVTSDTDGAFAAADLAPGSYVVEVAAAAGYAVAPTGARYAVSLGPGDSRMDLTLGQVTASVAGRAFRDTAADGDAGTEPGIGGASVRLTGTDVRGHEVDATTRTDADGRWAFRGLLAGTYALTAPAVEHGVLLPVLAPAGDLLDGIGVGGLPVGAGAALSGFAFAYGPVDAAG